MLRQPPVIKLDEIPDVLAREFPDRDTITVYVGSNAATPTASLDTITAPLKAGQPRLPYLRTVHLRHRRTAGTHGGREGAGRRQHRPPALPRRVPQVLL